MAGLLQATGYLIWIGAPGLAGFALGFVLWGLGGALSSGSIQALVHDGLAVAGAAERYAGPLFGAGGCALVGWAGVGVCIGAFARALGLPRASPRGSRSRAARLPRHPRRRPR